MRPASDSSFAYITERARAELEGVQKEKNSQAILAHSETKAFKDNGYLLHYGAALLLNESSCNQVLNKSFSL